MCVLGLGCSCAVLPLDTRSARHPPASHSPLPGRAFPLQIIPVWAQPANDTEDALLRTQTKCPAYDALVQEWTQSDAYRAKEAETAQLREAIVPYIPTALGSDVSLVNFWNMCVSAAPACCACCAHACLWLPAGARPAMASARLWGMLPMPCRPTRWSSKVLGARHRAANPSLT